MDIWGSGRFPLLSEPESPWCLHLSHACLLPWGSPFSIVQSLIMCDSAAPQASLCFTLPEFAHTHILRVRDAIQPSHLLSLTSAT